MDQQPLLEMHLRSLRLPTMLANYRRLAGEVAAPMTYLTQLASLEVDKRHENGVRSRVAAAHFPVIKTIESFDFSLQPLLPKAKVLELFDCTFIDHRRNLICIGPSLIAAKRDNLLDRKLRSLNRYDILLIDELGYIPFERTDLLSQIISQRYERSSIAITTNLAFSTEPTSSRTRWLQLPSSTASFITVASSSSPATASGLKRGNDVRATQLRQRNKAGGPSCSRLEGHPGPPVGTPEGARRGQISMPKEGQFLSAVSDRVPALGGLDLPSGSRRSPSRDGSTWCKASLAALGGGTAGGLAPRARGLRPTVNGETLQTAQA